jgi:hypothetical protein
MSVLIHLITTPFKGGLSSLNQLCKLIILLDKLKYFYMLKIETCKKKKLINKMQKIGPMIYLWKTQTTSKVIVYLDIWSLFCIFEI